MSSNEGTKQMIVIGTDTHKRTHTAVAVVAGTGELSGELTASARPQGFAQMLGWAGSLDGERVWAIEDCRHVSGGLERFLIARGERVVRVAPKLMGAARKGARSAGKSDSIDALAIARAAVAEGPERLPAATVDEQAHEIKLLLDHHDDLVAARSDDQRRLRWHLHDLWPELELPAGCLDRERWLQKVSRRLARAEQSTRVTISRELVVAIRARTRRIRELERELGVLVQAKAPQLLELRGCGVLTAARIVGDVGDITRFSSDAKLARLAGIAPIPVSSGMRERHRLDRRGNRKLNCAFHRLAVAQGRFHADAGAYLERKQAEGRTRMDALRCLKRYLVRRVFILLTRPLPTPLPIAQEAIGLT
jgi:transposase